MAAPPIGNYFTEQHNGEQVVDCRGSRLQDSRLVLNKEQDEMLKKSRGKRILLRDPENFDPADQITQRKSKIDALVIQSRGTIRAQTDDPEKDDDECVRCQRAHGPFKDCVVLQGYGYGCCGNCKWHDQASDCDLLKTGKAETMLNPDSPNIVQLRSQRQSKPPPLFEGMVPDPKSKEAQMKYKKA